MTDYKLRSIDTGMGTGNRTTIRLDAATWGAVDAIAGRRGVKWSEWVRDLLKQNPDAPNATAVIRNATVNALMAESFLSDENRGFDLAVHDAHALMRNSASLSDAELESIMKTATIQGRSDHGGFEVVFGQDDAGQDCVWIINGLRSGLHFAFTTSTGGRQCSPK
ncbi:MAG: ribbon-helix-helix domain-containing protein [Rhodoferax sp.]|nr:ribbon-helix-helix domain-containing protein [Rhodoferax sp.]